MKATRTWIVICDGGHARVLENCGPGKGLTAVDDLVFAQETPHTSDLVSDRQGRTFDSAGAGRHAMEPPTDPRRALKEDFIDRVAHVVGVRREDYDRVILVAPPAALGRLRLALPTAVADKVVGELGKDLTRVPNDDVATHLTDLLAL